MGQRQGRREEGIQGVEERGVREKEEIKRKKMRIQINVTSIWIFLP